ncbi:MBOAT family protein [Bowmanella denitrificans]|uniref:Probable alginate O-acetylase n=1 Tax=Bowmanella denitrificans TaxID=366582 RepID=A0ABN0XPR1_9ALTE
MLFNSFEFIFVFLPLTLCAYIYCARRWGNEAAIGILVLASLFFYSYWNPAYLPLLLFSMLFNFFVGRYLGVNKNKVVLTLGVITNLGVLGYYKYAGFFMANMNAVFNNQWDLGLIILPLAISFFTFQQIAYLVDSYQGITKEYSFLHYSLFVSFFPQLIAGPIVHHKEMLPQFESSKPYQIDVNNLIVGLSIFSIGLFKKTVLADGIAVYANPVFSAADTGQMLDFFYAWSGVLAYTLQLYFDFSGYSDMAIGLARIFGIVLPLNFYSPYKACNISEFWRRWHMTLSRFLRDYVYIPMGGNRKGPGRRYVNLVTTMLLGGLWHGAGWNFVIWGALHGAYLTIHQLWVSFLTLMGFKCSQTVPYKVFFWLVTFVAVVVGWVFFRATTLEGALRLVEAMVGLQGISLPNALYARMGEFGSTLQLLGIESNARGGVDFVLVWLWIAALLPVVLMLPNTQDLFSRVKGSLSNLDHERKDALWPLFKLTGQLVWKESRLWACLCAVALGLGLLTLTQVSEFLYFQF